MSLALRDLLKVSAPVLVSAALLSGCGSGSGGSADLDKGDSVESPSPPVTVTETFNFKATADYFVVGTPPIHARFSGGQANGNGAWVVPAGQTGVVDFGTPADAVKFSSKDNYPATAAAGSGAQKSTQPVGQAKMDFPFDRPIYVRGLNGDWTAQEPNQLKEVSGLDNVLERVIALQVWAGEFKVADAGWGQDIGEVNNCGLNDDSDTLVIGTPYQVLCKKGSGNILIDVTEAGNYLFRFDARNPDNITLTVTKDTGGGDGGGGEEPEDSTEIRIYAVDVLTPGAQPTLFNTVKGTGTLNVDELRQGGATRITRIEVENKGTAGAVGIEDFQWTANPRFAPAAQTVDIYYSRPAGSTAGTTIAVGGQTYNCVPASNNVGCVVRGVSVMPYANASMTVTNADGTQETITFNGGSGAEDVFAYSGSSTARSQFCLMGVCVPFVPSNANEVILYYKRDDNNYAGWGVHLFPLDPATGDWTTWESPFPPDPIIDPVWGAHFRIALPGKESPRYSANPAALSVFPKRLGFIIHKGDVKDPGPDQVIEIAKNGNTVFVVSGVNDVSSVPPGSGTALRISGAAAHWVDGSSLLWTPPEGVTKVELLYSPNASINAGLSGITGTFETIALTAGTNPKPTFNKQLHSLKAWTLPATAAAKARDLARGQLVLVGRNASNEAIAGTSVQFPGALDALYAEQAAAKTLGVSYTSGVPTLSVWAPTALKDPGLTVNIYDEAGAKIESKPMTLDEASGVWTVTGTAAWDRKFYTISLKVFSYAANAIVTNEVTDPYSVSLATDSVRSQFVNLDDADLKPAGWDTLTPPALAAPEDIVLYELHVRDFSIADPSVPPADRGKFTAFDLPGTTGRNHLQALAAAGLTHVHILPAFDFATVKENPADQVNLDDKVEKLCAANSAAASLCTTDAGKTIRQAMQDAVATNQLDRPAQITEWMRNLDGFNWGYDPLHFGAPEGSYATNPNGATRIFEFRRMVKGLNELGLRTVLDVVYNHTNASGQNGRATLDRLVPGYYHRRDNTSGNVLKDSCCDDTAAEFRMMEKLMIDTGAMWVRDYKVSGFRFDIMSFHPLDSMVKFQNAVKAVNPSVYVYGEGWNFGAVQDDKRFKTARQANLGGTGIGSFSDRIRDPVRGGGPFDSGGSHVKNQGFVSGWFYAPNAENSGSAAERDALTEASDNIRAWLAGGLATYRFTNSTGSVVTGADVDYNGQKSGYTKDPQEAVNYASKHDNETIWDISQYKHATGTPLAERVRADNVAASVIMLAQGIPFIHAGTELLRSKSMDRNSYDSGDWYNEIDWTLLTSKWNQGLPRAADNLGNYDQVKNVILDVSAVQDQAARQAALANFKELLAIRKSSPLFRLRTQSQIDKRLKFYNTGPFQIPGVVAMTVDGCTEPGLTPSEGALMVIFNASDDARTLNLFGNESWTLHPVQQGSADAVVKGAKHDANGFYVPARTTAVFRRAAQTGCAPYANDLYLRGTFYDWGDPAPETYRMQLVSSTSYSVTAPVPAGAQSFKISTKSWGDAPDCGAVVGGQTVELGKPSLMSCSGSPPNLGMPASTTAGNYLFELDATDSVNPTLTVSKAPPFAVDLYVRGEMNGWADPPPASAKMTHDGTGKYRVVLSGLNAASYNFKVADSGWGGSNAGASNCGAPGGGTSVTLGQPFTMLCPSNDNMSITLPAAGSYVFTADFGNPASPALTVTRTAFDFGVYVRGSFNGWANPPPANTQLFELGGGLLTRTLLLSSGETNFKVADATWDSFNCGGGTATPGTPVTLSCGGSSPNTTFNAAAAGYYSFTLDANNKDAPTVTVKGP